VSVRPLASCLSVCVCLSLSLSLSPAKYNKQSLSLSLSLSLKDGICAMLKPCAATARHKSTIELAPISFRGSTFLLSNSSPKPQTTRELSLD
jgi:hypothetical protein